jgi:hypothetical protein
VNPCYQIRRGPAGVVEVSDQSHRAVGGAADAGSAVASGVPRSSLIDPPPVGCGSFGFTVAALPNGSLVG